MASHHQLTLKQAHVVSACTMRLILTPVMVQHAVITEVGGRCKIELRLSFNVFRVILD